MTWKSLAVLLVAVPTVLCFCSDYPVQKNFQLKKMDGMWYGQYSKANIKHDFKSQRLHIYVKPDGKSVDLIEATLPLGGATTKGESFYATGKQSGTDGKLDMSAKLSGNRLSFKYNILATDYTNYMIQSMCIQGVEGLGILTRTPDAINTDVMNAIKESLKDTKQTIDKFVKITQNFL